MFNCILNSIQIQFFQTVGIYIRTEEGRSAFKTGKPTGKRPLGRPRRRWEDNITIDLEEIGINAKNWADRKSVV